MSTTRFVAPDPLRPGGVFPGSSFERLAEPRLRVRDNPIARAQARRRLRRRQTAPLLAVVAILALCALLLGIMSANSETWGVILTIAIGLMCILLYGPGTMQVNAVVAEDRSTRLLDFHRASPTTAWSDALGYASGPAAREYAGAAVLVPFVLLFGLMAGTSPLVLLAALGMVMVSACLYHVLGMFLGLTMKRRRPRRSALGFILMLYFAAMLVMTSSTASPAHLTPVPALRSLGLFGQSNMPESLFFFGLPLGHPLYSLLLQTHLIAFLFWASARKLRREGAHAFTRVGALSFYTLTAVLLIGPFWSQEHDRAAVTAGVLLYTTIGIGMACALAYSVVPSYLEFVRTERRAQRLGRRTTWREEGASAMPLVPAFAFLIAAGLGLVALLLGQGASTPELLYSREAAVFLLAGSGFLALVTALTEFQRLANRGAARSMAILFVFSTFLLPWILGGIVTIATEQRELAAYLTFTCPASGLWFSMLDLAATWGGEAGVGTGGFPIYYSIGVSWVLAAWLVVRGHTTRADICRGLRKTGNSKHA